MIHGVGTDLCEIARIGRALENDRFLLRIYTPAEQERLSGLGPERRIECAAGLFAAKEAIAKALGTGFTGFGFADIEILPDEKGCPRAALHGGAADVLQKKTVHVSISHDGGMALAFAVIESKGGSAE